MHKHDFCGEQSIYTRAILANYKNMYAWFFCGGGGHREFVGGGGARAPQAPPVATPLSGIRIKSRKTWNTEEEKKGEKVRPSIAINIIVPHSEMRFQEKAFSTTNKVTFLILIGYEALLPW